jgi:hypothetical protein
VLHRVTGLDAELVRRSGFALVTELRFWHMLVDFALNPVTTTLLEICMADYLATRYNAEKQLMHFIGYKR